VSKKQLNDDTETRRSQILRLEDGAKHLGLRIRKVRKWCREGMRIAFVRRGTMELMIIDRGVPSTPPAPKPRKVTGNMATNVPPEVWSQAAGVVHYPPGPASWRS
jgi:hypothetical protein